MKKPTRLATNSPYLARVLHRTCPGGHRHVHLVGGRAAAAAEYTPEFCRTVVKGIRHQRRADLMDAGKMGELLQLTQEDPEELLDVIDLCNLQPGSDEVAYDDAKGGTLPVHLVKAARQEEMAYVRDRHLYEYKSIDECLQRTGKPPVPTKWVDTNKGDDTKPDIRARLVAMEIRRPWSEKWFAATPPTDSLRYLLACAASEKPRELKKGKRSSGEPLKLLYLDVSRAHWYAKAKRDVYIKLPAEDPRSGDPSICGKLCKSMYGTLDAAQLWAEDYTTNLERAGFEKGKASPCHFRHSDRDVNLMVYGDDFVAVARQTDLEYLAKTLEQHYKCKWKVVGPERDDVHSCRILGRIVSYQPWGISYEADPVHAEMIIRDLGLEGCKPLSSPMAREELDRPSEGSGGTVTELRRQVGSQKHCNLELVGPDKGDVNEGEDLQEDSPLLDAERHARYRSLAARCTYLSIDRPDLQFTAKELMRRMAHPTESDEIRLKRMGRYLRGCPRLILLFPWSPLPAYVDVYVDSDFAGCRLSRKSTSGGGCLLGSTCLKSWARTQPTIALSSGEAELGATVTGATEALGIAAVLGDFGHPVKIRLRSDATAAIGMVAREGLGKVRHLATADL